jgi:hypothetical protein
MNSTLVFWVNYKTNSNVFIHLSAYLLFTICQHYSKFTTFESETLQNFLCCRYRNNTRQAEHPARCPTPRKRSIASAFLWNFLPADVRVSCTPSVNNAHTHFSQVFHERFCCCCFMIISLLSLLVARPLFIPAPKRT